VYLRPVGLNDLDLLALVVDRLEAAGAGVLVFGGWAEELLRLTPPRPHADIDLLLPAASFAAVDRFLAAAVNAPKEIRAKRFAHKRAFRLNGVTIEITLVEHDGGPVTRFWGDIAFRWLVPLGRAEPASGMVRPLPVVTRENLVHYRRFHRLRQPWRWRDPASIVA
jgi:hypothetical protein